MNFLNKQFFYAILLFLFTGFLPVLPDQNQDKQVTIQKIPEDPATPSTELTKRPVGILFAGDTHFEWAIDDMQKKYSMYFPAENLKSMFDKSDFRILNLETTISEKTKPVNSKSYVFRAHPQQASLLNYLDINLAVIANNHTMDMGPEGLENTLRSLTERAIPAVGAGMDYKEARSPYYFTVRGVKFAVVSLSTIGAKELFTYGKNPGVLPLTNQIYRDIAAAKKSADHVIVSIHWGIEYSPRPDRNQIIIARRMIDFGATAVIGHHPHIPQAVEYYKHGVIAYSLGNFLFGSINHYQSTNFVIQLLFHPENSSLYGIEIYPITGDYKKTGHKVSPLTENDAEHFWKRFYTQCLELNPIKPEISIQKEGYGIWLKK
ncbi:MAG: CapA family protein [Spirochaetia bacterium]|nr:CapA family protein [Spirochaetia bacterium]